jgi:arylsulfatase A-like enzyme
VRCQYSVVAERRSGPDNKTQRTNWLVIGLVAAVIIAVVGRILLLSSSGSGSHPPNSSQRPNILIIVTDDQRGGLGVMPKTRRIFERGGTDFTNAFVSDPLCCPSRASIFTGRYPHNHHVETEEQANNLVQASTLQRYLHDDGYETAIFGKYLNSWNIKKRPPYFDRWSIFTLSEFGYRNTRWNVNGKVTNVPTYSTSYISQQALSFLRSAGNQGGRKPWFLYLAPAAPHFPYTPAKKYARAPVSRWPGDRATSEQDRSDKPPFVLAKRHVTLQMGRRIRRKQFRTLMSVDDMVGKVFGELNRLHDAGNTLAIFTSDNGYLWGEHGLGGKDFPYTESIQVPLLERWPSHVASRTQDPDLVSNVDIAPTALEAAGLRPSALYPMDGRSLLDRTTPRKLVYSEYFNDPKFPRVLSWASVRSRSYQYIEYFKGTNVVFREYYNLRSDPWELDNVLDDGDPTNNGAAKQAAVQLRRARVCRGTTCP